MKYSARVHRIVWLIDVFLIVFGQQYRFLAQRNKLCETLIILVWINTLLVLVFSCNLLTIRKNTEYHHPFSSFHVS